MPGKKRSLATTSQSYHAILQKVTAGGLANLAVTPTNLGNRATSEADAWTLWRVRSFRFRIFGDSTATSLLPVVCGVQEGAPNTVAASNVAIMDLVPSVMHCGANETEWSRWVTVPKSVCAGEFPWYQTFTGTFTASQSTPFTLCWAGGGGTSTILTELFFTLEFKSQANTADTPMSLQLAARVREERALSILAQERNGVLRLLGTGAAGGNPGPFVRTGLAPSP